jgi:hypothetical protein
VWVAAARRFSGLLGTIAGAAVVVGAALGLLTGTSLNRSISLAFYIAGAFLVAGGFVLGIRGPYRPEPHETSVRIGRRLRRTTPEEAREAVNLTVLLVVLGLVLLAIGTAIDSRYQLI